MFPWRLGCSITAGYVYPGRSSFQRPCGRGMWAQLSVFIRFWCGLQGGELDVLLDSREEGGLPPFKLQYAGFLCYCAFL